MNYKKIEFLLREKSVSLEKLGSVVGITGAGFKRMIIKKTCSVAYLEKIADYFNVPIEYFFDDTDLTLNSILEANKMLDSGNNILIKHLLKDKANLEMLVEKLVEENESLKRLNQDNQNRSIEGQKRASGVHLDTPKKRINDCKK